MPRHRAEQALVTRWGEADDGSVVQVSVPESEASALKERWPPIGLEEHERNGAPVERVLSLRLDVAGGLTVEVDGKTSLDGWDRVESELALFSAERLAGKIAVHAAAIAMNGRALLVPGPSGAGKSSLCVAAAEAGATILSDEYALIDIGTATVTGWQRPVRIRRPDGGVDRLDLAEQTGPMPVALVALLVFQPGTALMIQDLAPSTATLGLLANTVCARSRPHESLDATLLVASTCNAVKGIRGDAAEAIEALLLRLTSPFPEKG